MGENVKLGSKVKDKVSGFTGVATARCEYLDSPPRVLVETAFDGKLHEEWFAEARIEVVG